AVDPRCPDHDVSTSAVRVSIGSGRRGINRWDGEREKWGRSARVVRPSAVASARLSIPARKGGSVEETEQLRAARAMRRRTLGDEYVDSQTAEPNPTLAEFQDYVTSTAWGVWTRGGALSPRDRSLLVLAMTAALGRMEEFRLH